MLTVTTMLPTKCFLNFFIFHKLACWPLHGVPIVVTAALHLFTHYGHAAVCWLVSSAVSCHKNALIFYFFDWHIGVSVPKCMLVCVWGGMCKSLPQLSCNRNFVCITNATLFIECHNCVCMSVYVSICVYVVMCIYLSTRNFIYRFPLFCLFRVCPYFILLVSLWQGHCGFSTFCVYV